MTNEQTDKATRRMQKPCVGCGYYSGCCIYILMTGHRRPCPPGDQCTVYLPVRKEAQVERDKSLCRRNDFLFQPNPKTGQVAPNINVRATPALARVYLSKEEAELYDSGHSDPEIARALGVHKVTVAKWRKLTNRPSITRPGRKRDKAKS